MRFLKKMFSGKLGKALMPIVAIILFLWLVQSSMGPDADISDVVQEIFDTVSSSTSISETTPDSASSESNADSISQTNSANSAESGVHAIEVNPAEFISVSDIPAYSGDAYIAVNDNTPYFSAEDYSTEPFEYYSDLDSLGRCGVTYAVVCQETMPTEKRESISEVKPSGWKNKKYDFVDGSWVYNRCHLIGFQLTAENANKCNLITGTRYLNIEGMLPFENMVADYVHESDGHVLYRVTPIYDGDNLVASGVLMEGYSVEDSGESVEYCVYCYNVQPRVTINYATGENWAA